jgi:flavodoxin
MKALVVYYSRTGNTKKVGDELAEMLACDVEELVDMAGRAGPVGFLKSVREGSGRMMAKLEPLKHDPADYDMVIIGTPNWDANMCSPVRTYLTENRAKLRNVAFFLTQGPRGGAERAFAEMEAVANKKPKATLAISTILKVKSDAEEKIKKFAEEIKA